MKITALEEYGLRCMLLLARNGKGTLTLPDFNRREGLSIPYAAKLLMILKKAGLVKAIRGRNGGYALSRAADKIFLSEVFEALGEPVFTPAHCQKFTGDEDSCVHTGDCSVRDIWKGFGGLIGSVLQRMTLADILSGNLDLLTSMQSLTAGSATGKET